MGSNKFLGRDNKHNCCIEKYKKCIALAMEKNGAGIEACIGVQTSDRLRSFAPEALGIWIGATRAILGVEELTKVPFRYKKDKKLYALDGIVVADTLGINEKQRFAALQVFSIYYLSVHLFDDIVEDSGKFHSKFKYSNVPPLNTELNASGMSFILHAALAVSNLLTTDLKLFSRKSVNKIMQAFIESLAKQTRYFTLEKDNLTPEEVLEIKQRKVSGEATSFLFDVLQLGNCLEIRQGIYAKNALRYLGSLTQFTDDLRDYEKDKETGNANILVSMEQKYANYARDKFAALYVDEERRMLMAFRKAGLSIDKDLLKAIPWHPFFMKNIT